VHWLPFARAFFRIHLLSGSCFGFYLLAAIWEDFFPIDFTDWKRGCSSTESSFALDLHQTTQSFDLPIFFDHCSCSDSDKLFHATTVGPSTSPQNFRSPRPANWKKGGSDITASPLSLLAVLILDYFLRGNKSKINQSGGNMHSSESPWPPLSSRSQTNPFKGQRLRPPVTLLQGDLLLVSFRTKTTFQ